MTDEEPERLDGVEVRDHLERDVIDECGYCGQVFGPDETHIERLIFGRTWRFCSDECYHDFRDLSNFKDEDLDSDKKEPHASVPVADDDE